uniref:BTB domain-containing protein n=1 Tax=Rhabditophanes sp. KR3021 TaxID=114890 RepID=A0AC35UAQ1_9BILA
MGILRLKSRSSGTTGSTKLCVTKKRNSFKGTKTEYVLDMIKAHLMDSQNKGGHNLKSKLEAVVQASSKDVILMFPNKQISYVNFDLLVNTSQYFKMALNGPFSTSMTLRLNMLTISKRHFEVVMRIVHHKDIKRTNKFLEDLSPACLIEIFDVATFLLVDKAIERIGFYILTKSHSENIVAVYNIASLRNFELACLVKQKLIYHFLNVALNKTYLDLDEKDFLDIFTDKRCDIPKQSEAKILYGYVAEHFDKRKTTKVLELYKKLIEPCASNNFADFKRLPNKILLSIGGWVSEGPTNEITVYNYREDKWTKLPEAMTKACKKNSYQGVCKNKDYIYSVGGFDASKSMNTCSRFNLKRLEWESVSNMHDKRSYCKLVAINDKNVIALGGFDGSKRLTTTEYYAPASNQWEKMRPMLECRSDLGALYHKANIYVCGGFDGKAPLKTVEFYDFEADRWFKTGKSMQVGRSGINGIETNGGIFIAGGYDGNKRLYSAEFYDSREGIWQLLGKPLKECRSNYGMEKIGDGIVFCGGFNGNLLTDSCELFDPRAQSTIIVAPLQSPRSALSLVKIENCWNIESMLGSA